MQHSFHHTTLLNVFATLQLLTYLNCFSRCSHLPLSLLLLNPSCLISSAPPSAPVSLSWEYESGDGGVSLRWRHPVDMGGRSEVWYGIVCRICPSATITNPTSCSWCGEGVTFSPSQTNLKQTKVTLNNLLTRVTYLIQVSASRIRDFSWPTPPSTDYHLFYNQLVDKVNITEFLIWICFLFVAVC